MPGDKPGPRRGLLQRAPRWARPLIAVLLIALVIGVAYVRTTDPLEDTAVADGPVVPILVMALGLTSIFWGVKKVDEQDRQEMQDNVDSRVRLMAKLTVPALRAFFILAGIAIVALGIAALLD